MVLTSSAVGLPLATSLCLLALASAVPAVPCNLTTCSLPSCRCSSTATPGGLSISKIPHFVVLSFDDAVTSTNYPLYLELSNNINPDQCKIKMTFFVSHENTDYTLVHDLYAMDHEIASHSVTHRVGVDTYWHNLTPEQWSKEIVQQKEMLKKYGNIPDGAVKGFRAPFLEVGGNNMYSALKEANFDYDCSWPTLRYTPWFQGTDGNVLGALWPYTLDYLSVQDQTVGTKPTEAFPGMWVAPMTDLQDNRRIECSMLDGCQSVGDELETSAPAVADLLKRNFKAHINTRTPFGIYVHQSWFTYPARQEGFKQFLAYLSAFPEVYVVSVRQLMAWVKNPKSVDDLADLDEFKCVTHDKTCTDTATCNYSSTLPINQTEVVMKKCSSGCPPNYPYLDNVDGELSYPLP